MTHFSKVGSDVIAGNHSGAISHGDVSSEDTKGCGLPCSINPYQPKALPAGYAQEDAPDGRLGGSVGAPIEGGRVHLGEPLEQHSCLVSTAT